MRDQDIGPCWDDGLRAPADPIEADAIDIDRAVTQEVNRAQQFTHVWLNCEDQVVVPRHQYLVSVRERPQPANVPPQRIIQVGWSRFRAVLMLLSAYPQRPPASMARS